MLNTFRFLGRHPLTRGHKIQAIKRWLQWQLGSRLAGQAIAMPFVNDSRLLVRPGMTGATGNIYCGLHEFEDMAFVAHLLRPGDRFADVGANVGSYSILAAATGAQVVSFEPIPAAFQALLDNVHLNRMASQVTAVQQAVGAEEGMLHMTHDQDTTNHATTQSTIGSSTAMEVSQTRLDIALRGFGTPKLIKIDVEGFESQVLDGASGLLSDPRLEALIVELNGSSSRYGFDDDKLHHRMLGLGFKACIYEPFTRQITQLQGARSHVGNTLYLRFPAAAQMVVHAAPRLRVLGREL